MLRSALTRLIALLLLGNPARALAEEEPIPLQRVNYDSTTGIRLNPLGLETLYTLGYRYRMHASTGRALRENDIGVVLNPTLNPAVARMGGFLEFRPLTMLTLQAGLYHTEYFGAFKALQTFDRASDEFSDTRLAENADKGLNHPRSGLEATLRAQAVAKVGPIVLRSDLMFVYSHFSAGKLYYNPRLDVLAPIDGWFLQNDTDLLYLTDFGLAAGARASTTHAFYGEDVLGGAASEDDVPMFRLGPLVAYTFYDKPERRFNKPTLIGIAGWWLAHRYRTGLDVNQAIPCVTLAFRFEGDLFATRP
ncbi:MAG: hypothetical protein U0414_13035 [Polyangiaceae bacterium]